MPFHTPTKTARSSGDDDHKDDQLSPLAKRIPGVKKGGDPKEFRRKELCRKSLVRIVDYLVKHEDQCPEIWSMITTDVISVEQHKPIELFFADPPKCVNKTDPLFRAQWIVDNSEGTIQMADIRHLHAGDEQFIEDVTNMFCKWSGNEPLSKECQERRVLCKVMTLRYEDVGCLTISAWWQLCWVPSTKTINWMLGGCYQLKFDDAVVIGATHRSGKQVEVVPTDTLITDKFVIENSCSEMNATAVLKASRVKLCDLFPKDCKEIFGNVLDKKGLAMKSYIKKAVDGCKLPVQAVSASSSEALVDHGKRKRTEALAKARAKLGDKPVKRARSFNLA